ncbi:TetR/AcrR family transcriptional regulator [Streptomyces celluloflavus]
MDTSPTPPTKTGTPFETEQFTGRCHTIMAELWRPYFVTPNQYPATDIMREDDAPHPPATDNRKRSAEWRRHMTSAGTPTRAHTTQPLTRAHIVAAGLRLLERHGTAGLSMRKLANELGKAPAAVYRHVSDKRELMTLLFDEVSHQFTIPAPGDNPRNDIIKAVENAHRVMKEHPWTVTLILDGTPPTPHILRLSQFILDTMIRKGMTDTQAAHLHTAIWQYTLGHLLMTQNKKWHQPPHPHPRTKTTPTPNPYPTLQRIAPLINHITHHNHFTTNLATLIDKAFALTP